MGKLQKAIEICPKSGIIRDNLARTLAALGRFSEAYQEFGKVSDSEGTYVFGLTDRAHTLSIEGRFKEADDLWRRVSQLSPRNTYNLSDWSNGLSERSDWRNALSKIKEAELVFPTSGYLQQREAELLWSLNEYSEGERVFNRVVGFLRAPKVFATWAHMLDSEAKGEEAKRPIGSG